MNKKLTKISLLASALLISTSIYADDKVSKHTLKSNYQVLYNEKPATVESFTDMFAEGKFYGRLRSNNFYFGWEKEKVGKRKAHVSSGLGGSLIYKSATLNNFDFSAGLYYSQGFFDDSSIPVARLKAGADVISRYNYSNTGSKSMGVLGQAFVRYQGIAKTELLVGRQLVETFYTKSNDTKMIPNTFDGVVIATKAVSKTAIKIAYLTEQKLRNHTDAHSTLMYDDSDAANFSKYNANDDSAMHKGLSYTNLKAAGVSTDAPLIVGDVHNKSIKNLKLDASFYVVPELVSEIMLEANYKIDMNGFSLSPGVRYIKQFDNGAGEIGGANYSGSLAGVSGKSGGYNNADSLESQMIAARLVAKYSNYKLNLGYSQIFDEADLITPWRGFPTSGYTRSMARYNWRANTKSYRIELVRNGNKTNVYKDVFIQMSILHTDADEDKGYFDENYYYVGFVQNVPALADLQWRLRLGYNDTEQEDSDNLDARFELNYLF